MSRCKRCCVCASREVPRQRFGNFSWTHQRRHMRFAGLALADPVEPRLLTPPTWDFAEEPAVAALIPKQTPASAFAALAPRRTTIWMRIRQIAAGLFGGIFS